MGQVISKQHPAVVLRGHYRAVRALLCVAIVAVVALSATLVIVASDDHPGTSSASPTGQINYGSFNPATGRPESAPLPQRDAQAGSHATRHDGGPEEGSGGIGRSTPVPEVYVNPSTGYPSTVYDGGPDEGIRGPQSDSQWSSPLSGYRADDEGSPDRIGGPRMTPMGGPSPE